MAIKIHRNRKLPLVKIHLAWLTNYYLIKPIPDFVLLFAVLQGNVYTRSTLQTTASCLY